MPSFTNTRRVPHKAEDMFALVADVERYPEFLPLCESLKVLRRTKDGEGREVIVASMSVGYKAIHEAFTSRVTLDRANLNILVEYVDGPFEHLENRWNFVPDAAGSRIEFFIDYAFRSFTLQLLMGAMFDRAFRKFVEAFERRADRIYPLAS